MEGRWAIANFSDLETEEEELIDDGDEVADILAAHIYALNLYNHALYKDDPIARAEFEEKTGLDFDMQLVHPSKWR